MTIGEENVEEKEETSYGSLMIERLTGSEGRIDHVLQVCKYTVRCFLISF